MESLTAKELDSIGLILCDRGGYAELNEKVARMAEEMTRLKAREAVKFYCTRARTYAEMFHPREYILEEMQVREMTTVPVAIQRVLDGSDVNPHAAAALNAMFGMGAQYWLNLQAAFTEYRCATNPDQI